MCTAGQAALDEKHPEILTENSFPTMTHYKLIIGSVPRMAFDLLS